VAPPPSRVDVAPVANDEAIARRIREVLIATDWYVDPQVRVTDGVVFLTGKAKSAELKKWAGDLARNTQDVAAVANQLELVEPPAFDSEPVVGRLKGLWRDVLTALPFVGLALVVMALSLVIGVLVTRFAKWGLQRRIDAKLLRNVIAGAIGAFVFLTGVYVILRVSGLTQLALTVVGGTGLLGLVLGIAFRDITENFLASIFLSIQRPFMTGDLIEVAQFTGYVQQLNLRVTVLMTLEGNLVQIPNSTIYKSAVRNFTANTNRREDFVVGIGYEENIADAQEVALGVLLSHPAVLKTPEPAVLADNLGRATVNLRVYFWLNGREHSWLKVRSSVIRLVKRAFQERGISMPDEAREVIFPQGVAVTLREAEAPVVEEKVAETADAMAVKGEAGLESDAKDIERQAKQVRPLEEQENLLGG
jgi:small-conductance mechanosensitive channel